MSAISETYNCGHEPNVSKRYQTLPNVTKHYQTFPNVSKHYQTFLSQQVKLSMIITNTNVKCKFSDQLPINRVKQNLKLHGIIV